MRKPALSLAALLATASLAACGGVDKDTYVSEVTKVQQNTQKEATDLSAKMSTAKSAKQVGTNLEALAASVDKNAGALEKIEVPDDVTSQHTAYVKLMRTFATELEALATEVESATDDTLPGILTKAQASTTKLSTGEQKIVSEINAELQG